MNKDCHLCDGEIDFNNGSYVVFVDKKEDPETGKKKRVVKFSHYHCNADKVEEYKMNYEEFMTRYRPYMIFKKIFPCL